MSESLTLYVLDTSAWLTLIEDESGADTIQQLLEAAQAGEALLLTSFMSYMEVFYITLQERDIDEARERLALMAALPTQRVESSKALGVSAANIKAHYRLSVADAWIAALEIVQIGNAVLPQTISGVKPVGCSTLALPEETPRICPLDRATPLGIRKQTP